MKVLMFKKIFAFLMLSVAFGVDQDVPVKNQDFEKHELVQGNGDEHSVVHAIEGAVLAGSEVPGEGMKRYLRQGGAVLAGSEVPGEGTERELKGGKGGGGKGGGGRGGGKGGGRGGRRKGGHRGGRRGGNR